MPASLRNRDRTHGSFKSARPGFSAAPKSRRKYSPPDILPGPHIEKDDLTLANTVHKGLFLYRVK